MAAVYLLRKLELRKSQLMMGSCLNYSNFSKRLKYKKYYEILGVPEGSDQEEIRRAYLDLVKRYHPDSGTNEASAEKFSEIDKAFKALINKLSQERWNVEDEQIVEQDIKHTAPQHRQYLSYDGIGSGNPFQREKQYTKVRAMQAAENVLKHRISKVSAEEGALLAKTPALKHKIQTKYGFDRLVEDLIQESISKGEFNNLTGSGKPLKSLDNRNPYVDFVTHKLNEVLISNGFTPEWIMLQKEIREEVRLLRDCLYSERAYFGRFPLDNENDIIEWHNTVSKYEELARKINKMIDKFNLVVPILEKQITQINLIAEARKVLINGKHSLDRRNLEKKMSNAESQAQSNNSANSSDSNNLLFGYIESLFKLK